MTPNPCVERMVTSRSAHPQFGRPGRLVPAAHLAVKRGAILPFKIHAHATAPVNADTDWLATHQWR